MFFYKVNLQRFADGGTGDGGDGGAAANTTGVTAPDAGVQQTFEPRTSRQKERAIRRKSRVGQQTGTVANAPASDSTSPGTQQQPVQNEPADTAAQPPQEQTGAQAAIFDQILQDPQHKKEFDKRVNAMFRQRFGDEEVRREKDAQTAQLMTTLAQMLGVEVKDPTALDPSVLQQALMENQVLMDAAAMDAGIGSQQYRNDLQTRSELAMAKSQLAQQERQRQESQQELQRRQAFNNLQQEGERLKEIYPQFDFDQLMQDSQSVRAIQSLQIAGVPDPVRTIYEARHREEIMGSLAARAAQTGMQKVAASVAANQQRPDENGIQNQGGFQSTLNPQTLSKQQRQEIRRRVALGEKISM